jgi:hypothetical protein
MVRFARNQKDLHATVPQYHTGNGKASDRIEPGNMANAIKMEWETSKKTRNDSSSSIQIEETEVDLFQRIEKAAAHLATFCAKNKQAF